MDHCSQILKTKGLGSKTLFETNGMWCRWDTAEALCCWRESCPFQYLLKRLLSIFTIFSAWMQNFVLIYQDRRVPVLARLLVSPCQEVVSGWAILAGLAGGADIHKQIPRWEPSRPVTSFVFMSIPRAPSPPINVHFSPLENPTSSRTSVQIDNNTDVLSHLNCSRLYTDVSHLSSALNTAHAPSVTLTLVCESMPPWLSVLLCFVICMFLSHWLGHYSSNTLCTVRMEGPWHFLSFF